MGLHKNRTMLQISDQIKLFVCRYDIGLYWLLPVSWCWVSRTRWTDRWCKASSRAWWWRPGPDAAGHCSWDWVRAVRPASSSLRGRTSHPHWAECPWGWCRPVAGAVRRARRSDGCVRYSSSDWAAVAQAEPWHTTNNSRLQRPNMTQIIWPCRTNQLPDSFRQPRQSSLDSPPHSLVSSSLSSSPLSSSITSSLLHSRLKTYLFNKSFPP